LAMHLAGIKELSGLSWVRLVWKSPDNHIGKCKV
jgi:hypothetical protein